MTCCGNPELEAAKSRRTATTVVVPPCTTRQIKALVIKDVKKQNYHLRMAFGLFLTFTAGFMLAPGRQRCIEAGQYPCTLQMVTHVA